MMKKLLTLVISLAMTVTLMAPAHAAGNALDESRAMPAPHWTMETDPADDTVEATGSSNSIDTSVYTKPAAAPAPRPTAIPVPIPTQIASAWFRTESKLLDDDGTEVTSIVDGETYTLVATVAAELAEGHTANLDATNLRVRMNDFMIDNECTYTAYSGYSEPVFCVYDPDSEIKSGNATVRAGIIGSKRATVTYVSGSAELLTNDGTVIALPDEEFLSRDGTLIGSQSNDGIMSAEDICTVRIKLKVGEDDTSSAPYTPENQTSVDPVNRPSDDFEPATTHDCEFDKASYDIFCASLNDDLNKIHDWTSKACVAFAGVAICVAVATILLNKQGRRIDDLEDQINKIKDEIDAQTGEAKTETDDE